MKSSGYCACHNEIVSAQLPSPHEYGTFTEFFDTRKLDEIRDKYGVDLYAACYADALYEISQRR